MLQENVISFVNYANERGFSTQFETNGLLHRDISRGSGIATNTIVVSPKMPGEKYNELRLDVFDRADVLKFVVEREGKFNYIPDYAFKFKETGRKVYVSPINVYLRPVGEAEIPNFFDATLYNYPACRDNYQFAAEFCLKHDFILNMQKHLFINLE